MSDLTLDTGAVSGVPFAQVAETRRSFPSCPLTYEAIFETGAPLSGLETCVRLLRDAGLELLALRCSGEGRISCRLRDRRESDLGRLHRQVLAEPALSVSGWTTIVGSAQAA